MEQDSLQRMSPGGLADALEQALEHMTEETYDPAAIDAYLAALDARAPLPREPDSRAAFKEFRQRLSAGAAAPVKRRRPWLRRLGAVAAALAVIASLFTVALAASEDFRVGAMNWLIETFPGWAQVTFQGAPEAEVPTLTMDWIPDGYLLTETDVDFYSCCYVYRPVWSEEDLIRISCDLTHGLGTGIDTEDAEVTTLDVSGTRVISIRSDYRALYWTSEDGALLFSITAEGAGAEEDLVRVMENIRY